MAVPGPQVNLDRGHPSSYFVPLRAAFPEARIPVLQVSLPAGRTPRSLFELGRALGSLRREGVLLLASGGIVHNLGMLAWPGNPVPEPWAAGFEQWVAERVDRRDPASLFEAAGQAPFYRSAVPTSEHFDPLYFALGAAGDSRPRTVFQGWQLGNLSLRAWAWD